MAIIGNEDHKQRVNLSSLARTVIEMDRTVFDEGGSFSGFLNRIITAFRDRAESSIDLAVADRQQQYVASGCSPELAKRLTEEYRRSLKTKTESYPQGDSVMFRLNN